MQKILQMLVFAALCAAGTAACPPAGTVKDRARKMDQAHLVKEHKELTAHAARLGAQRRAATPGLDLTKEHEAYNTRLNEYTKKHAQHVQELHDQMAASNKLQDRPVRTAKRKP